MGLKLFSQKKAEQPRRAPTQAVVNRPKPTYYGNDKPRTENSVKARQITEQKRALWQRLRLVPTLIAVGAILLSVVFSTTLTTTPGIIFAGDQSVYHTIAEYKSGISKILDSSLMNKSKLTINTSSTERAIIKAFPELDVVKIGLPIIGRRPTVTLHVRKPALILTTKTNSYVLDSNGKAVANTSQLISSITGSLLTAQDQSGLQLHVGDQALTSETMSFIANLQAQLAAKQLTITSLTLPTGGNEIDVHLKDIGYLVKTDSSGDARLQIGDFIAAKESGAAPAEYMDVRVEEKVFYK
ncbi:MAG: hypothetical protein JWO47_4 [Candidatus Saccharibacteria bacterium]|nr:hypothetical protein [Candidatus Saccharibacteria bacterium]